MKMPKHYRMMIVIGAAILIISLGGCGSLGVGQSSPPPNPVAQSSEPDTPPGEPPASAPPASTPVASAPPAAAPPSPPPPTPTAPRPQFYDFQDIPIPSELDLVSKDSYVFQAGALKAGLLTLRGRVDVNSLINFFQMALPREHWKLKGGFRYKRSVLIFDKPDRTCIINLYEKMFYTYVEILVAPAGSQV